MAEDRRETDDLAAERARAGGRAGGAVVGGGRAQPGAAPRQPGAVGAPPTPSPTGDGPGRLSATSPAVRRCPSRWRSTCATAPTPHVEVDVPEGGSRGGPAGPGLGLGGWSLHLLDGRLRYVHNLYGKTRPRRSRPTACSVRAATPCGSTFEKDDRAADTAARRHRVRHGTSWPRGAIHRFTPLGLQRRGGRSHLRLRVGAGGGRGLHRARSPSTGPSCEPRWRRPGRWCAIRWPRWPPSCPSSDGRSGPGGATGVDLDRRPTDRPARSSGSA